MRESKQLSLLGGSLNLVFTVKLRTSTLFLLKLLLVAHCPSPSMHSVVHRPSHSRNLWPSRYHSLFCAFCPSGSHTDIPILLTPFMNWAETKGASLILLNQHKTDVSCFSVTMSPFLYKQPRLSVTFPYTHNWKRKFNTTEGTMCIWSNKDINIKTQTGPLKNIA